jgi:hypothetical protein
LFESSQEGVGGGGDLKRVFTYIVKKKVTTNQVANRPVRH